MTVPLQSDLEEIVDGELAIDEEELLQTSQERGKILDISDKLRLLAKQNRLSLFKKKAGRRKSPSGNWVAEAELQFQSHPHPDCRFEQVMLAVSFKLSPGARVLTVRPEQAIVHQVKVTESLKPAFEAEIPGIGIKSTLGAEKTTEQTFDQQVLISYNGENCALWTFKIPASGYELSLDVPLRLTVEFPASMDVLRAHVQISARVGVRGWPDYVPLVRKKSGEGNTPVYLDR
jgi:hypothetical protein